MYPLMLKHFLSNFILCTKMYGGVYPQSETNQENAITWGQQISKDNSIEEDHSTYESVSWERKICLSFL